ncbi:hypothetical protein VNO77_22530 [Canavalia gladiata]|uniref:Sucrose-phosphatase C-terminal domain-containing protein n=1 Tax=Canavalia gladiata TaxID=3824 RepID=A0AAN9L381_CANGL
MEFGKTSHNPRPRIAVRYFSDIGREQLGRLSPGHEIVDFNLVFEKWRHAKVENSELFITGIKAVTLPSSVYVHPSGSVHNLKEYANILRKLYGNKQGKQFRMWVDDVLGPDDPKLHEWNPELVLQQDKDYGVHNECKRPWKTT